MLARSRSERSNATFICSAASRDGVPDALRNARLTKLSARSCGRRIQIGIGTASRIAWMSGSFVLAAVLGFEEHRDRAAGRPAADTDGAAVRRPAQQHERRAVGGQRVERGREVGGVRADEAGLHQGRPFAEAQRRAHIGAPDHQRLPARREPGVARRQQRAGLGRRRAQVFAQRDRVPALGQAPQAACDRQRARGEHDQQNQEIKRRTAAPTGFGGEGGKGSSAKAKLKLKAQAGTAHELLK